MRLLAPLICLVFGFTTFLKAQSPGTLDNTFSGDGRVYAAPMGGSVPFNRSTGVVSYNNRIYVAGTCTSGADMDLGIVAFDLNGDLDPSFSGDGIAIINSGDVWDTAMDVIVQSDGKILIGGFNSTDFLVVRLNTNGTLDTSWGTNGIVTTDVTGGWERITRLALQSDGKIIAAGYSSTNINDITVVRYNTTGSVDTSFGTNGFINKDLQTRDDRIEGVAVQSDDKILLVGSSARAVGDIDGFAIRLTKDGGFDNTFNTTGISIIDYGNDEQFSGAAILPDGKIIVSGVKVSGSSGVYRYNSNGTLDSSFGVGGFADSGVAMWSVGVAYHTSKKYVLFGYRYGAPSRDFAIVSFNPEGDLDTCFGTDGVFTTDMGDATEDYATKGVVLSNGKLLITGQYDTDSEFALASVIGPSQYIDKSVTVTNNIITSNQTGAAYQWKDCNSGSDVGGETNQALTATIGSNYKVAITKDGCTVNSDCYYVTAYNYNLANDNTLTNTKGPSLGSAWGDYNNDGFDDLLVVNYANTNNFLFKNNGNKTFTRNSASVIDTDGSDSNTGSWGDYDNDGLLDLFVANNSGKNLLYHNKDGNSFDQILTGGIVNDITNAWDAAWVDFNNDGLLDVFVSNNSNNFLYKNTGNGQFVKITSGSIFTDTEASFSFAWGDYNNDGFIDLFVANYGNQNNSLYKNLGNGTFQKISTGAIVNDGGQSRSASWGDYNNDGFFDLYVTNSGQKNFLYKNNGDETFTKITNDPIVNLSNWAFSATWTDYNSDGYLDMAVVRSTDTDSVTLFSNNKDGSFSRIKDGSLLATGTSSWSISAADFNNDGYEDLYVAGRGYNKGYLFENINTSNNFLSVRLKGKTVNAAAIGTVVKVKSNDMWQTRQVSAHSGRASQGGLKLNFGLGEATNVDSLVILWPGKAKQILTDIDVNQLLSIEQCTPEVNDVVLSICDGSLYYFADIALSDAGQYTHVFRNIKGCDSTVVLTLSINEAQTKFLIESICKGDNYILGNQILSSSGEYNEIFKDVNGCDSTVYLTLNATEVNNTVTLEGSTLVADETDALYQWYACNDADLTIVDGASEKTFSPTSTGTYSASITKAGCPVYSDCADVVITAIEKDIIIKPNLYPNPVNGILTVDLGFNSKHVQVIILNSSGTRVSAYSLNNVNSFNIPMLALSSDLYFIEIIADRTKSFTTIFKN
jgi:uncharacterized delta-60 repeat protein